MIELAYFLLILIVIVFAFGICIQALMYHNQSLDQELMETVFFTSYMVIAGQNDIFYTMLNGISKKFIKAFFKLHL